MKFKLKDLLKRTCAMTVAIACFVTSACFMPIENYLQVQASEAELDFYFKNNINGEKIEQSATILEGIRVDLSDNLSEASNYVTGSYNYNTAQPLDLQINSTQVTNPTAVEAKDYIDLSMVSTTSKTAYVRPTLGLLKTYPQADSILYEIIPQIQYAIYPSDKQDSSLTSAGDMYQTEKTNLVTIPYSGSNPVESAYFGSGTKSIEFTDKENVIEFTYVGAEFDNMKREVNYTTDEDNPVITGHTETWQLWVFASNTDTPVPADPTTEPCGFWEITDQKGYFENYELTSVTNSNINASSGTVESNIKREYVFTLSSTVDGSINTVPITIDFGSLGNIATVKTGAKIGFEFNYETTDFLIGFDVISREDALEEIADVIYKNPTTQLDFPSNSSSTNYLKYNNYPFIFNDLSDVSTPFNENDISTNFYVRTNLAEYNYTEGFVITWEWVPDSLDSIPDYYYSNPKPTAPSTTEDDTDPDWIAYNAALTVYENNQKDLEINWEVYEKNHDANLSKQNAIQFKGNYNIVESTFDDTGKVTSHAWAESAARGYRTQGYMSATVTPSEDDVIGKLIPTIHVFDDTANFKSDSSKLGYDGTGDTIAMSYTGVGVEVKVTGRGVDPRFYITSATAATYDEDTYSYTQNGMTFSYEEGEQTRFPIFKYDETTESIKEVQLGEYKDGVYNMDVNNGAKELNQPPAMIPAGYSAPIPIAPWKVEGVIEFGSGIMQCDRLVVTNVSDITENANISMEYRVNYTDPTSVAEHNFATDGKSFEIPINANDFSAAGADYTYYFTIEAEAEGLMELDFHFYSAGSDTSKVKYENIGIQIGSSLPSNDALIDKVFLHMVQETTSDSAEDARIAEILASLYSDKSTVNSSENPYSGNNAEYNKEFLPTEIIYNTDFTYVESGNYYYYEVELPYVISDVKLTPIYDSVAQANKALYITVSDPSIETTVTGTGKKAGDYSGVSDAMSVISSNNSSTYDSPEKWILIETLAANCSTKEKYYLKLVQAEAASEVVLNDLIVETTDLLGEDITLSLTNSSGTVVQFETDPIGVGMRYYVSLPYYYYSQKIPVEITAISNGSWSKSPTIVSDDGLTQPRTSFLSSLMQNFTNKTTESFYLDYDDLYGLGSNAVGSTYPNKFTITTFSESSDATAEYYLTVLIEAPDKNDDLSSLQVLDPTSDDSLIAFKNGTFVKTKDDYIIEIPYELQKYRFSALPDSDNALAVRLTAPDGTVIATTTYATPGTPVQFLVDFEELGLTSSDLNFTFTIAVQSEDGIWSDQFNHPEGHSPYTILFQRSAPNTDSLLQSLDVLNFETAVALPEYVFEQVKKDYIFTVPYTTERIIIKPTAVEQERTTITINGVDFPDEDPGKDYYLTAGESNTFTIVVTAEDPAYTTTYNLYITRSNPDTEARLLNLVVNGAESTTPELFVPSTYTYDVVIPYGTKSYTITPTAVSEYSVIIIDGIVIPSGTATGAYNAVDEKTTIKVYVSAQDGVTTQTYTLNITNKNLIETSDDALLLDVNIQGVDIEPTFKSNIYDYEVYTKIDTTTLDITPTVSPGATVSVSVGSKKLDELNGIYSTSFFTETDIISIDVTSESGNVTKTYKFSVYKNTPDKEGIFQPITSSDIDWNGENPIVVDITKYSVVDASVFNTLKDSHPDKTIVFNGNDYMFRVTGSDITRNIPHTTQYDFGMSFTSPEEPLVQDILDDSDYEEDNELEPIYVYFNDHGALPAQMILTVILGSSVGDEQLYWNYYNTEFDRIDYYGYVQSNSKGTITVPIAHFSTYLVSTHQIYASEDRTNTGFGSLELGNHTSGQQDGSIGSESPGDDLTGGFGSGSGSNGNISGDLSSTKPNPQTEADPITDTARVNYEQTTVYKWYDERKKQLQDDEKQEC